MTDLDTFVYHEMLAHPALYVHPAPKQVAIVGGGDLDAAAEVLKHPGIEAVHVHELDGEIVEVATADYDTAGAVLADSRGSRCTSATRSRRSRCSTSPSTW